MTNESNRAAGENFDAMSWRELAETLAHYLSPALASAQYDMTDEITHEAIRACHQVNKRKIEERVQAESSPCAKSQAGTPTEDVRAMVDEPVAVVDEGGDGLFAEFIYGDDGSPLKRGDKLYLSPADKGYVSKLAYQAMQREVERLNDQRNTVMPERMKHGDPNIPGAPVSIHFDVCAGWNACIDEFKRLNPKLIYSSQHPGYGEES